MTFCLTNRCKSFLRQIKIQMKTISILSIAFCFSILCGTPAEAGDDGFFPLDFISGQWQNKEGTANVKMKMHCGWPSDFRVYSANSNPLAEAIVILPIAPNIVYMKLVDRNGLLWEANMYRESYSRMTLKATRENQQIQVTFFNNLITRSARPIYCPKPWNPIEVVSR